MQKLNDILYMTLESLRVCSVSESEFYLFSFLVDYNFPFVFKRKIQILFSIIIIIVEYGFLFIFCSNIHYFIVDWFFYFMKTLLQPIMPTSMAVILDFLNVPPHERKYPGFQPFGYNYLSNSSPVTFKKTILFNKDIIKVQQQ